MTSLTATTDGDGVIHVTATDGENTVERKGKGIYRTIISAAFNLKIMQIRDTIKAWRV